ncbi:Rare lipoprotein A (RlpA)-like double-psi beta-barrel family protein [Clavispora lusitaniae]|uniref:Rare lipoprotein A (RlpA)-like double-psi beta-barrel family protein n=1 Tax=Clavispora lusitaniae TaxID=36911 RepID=UPI00202BCE01|nr:Rare lipoprotein A (RlpA)-like double-psi beta-barrel family protein [Clavispora lusitaniae]
MKLSLLLVCSLAAANVVVEYVTVTAFVTMKKGQLGGAGPSSAIEESLWTETTEIANAVSTQSAPQELESSQAAASPSQAAVPLAAAEVSSEPSSSPSSSAPAQSAPAQSAPAKSHAHAHASSAPAQSHVHAHASAASSAPAQSSSQASSGSFSGDGTYYDTGMGACGTTSTDSDFIVAVSKDLFDQYTPNGNPNHNSLCGKKIEAFYEGKSVEVTVVDRCEGCAYGSLDFSPAAFRQLADQGLGRIKITWNWA